MRRVFMLLYDIDVNKGGITRVLFNRSKALSNRGYNVDLITLDYKDNYKEISNKLRKMGRLSKNVEILNVYDYYRHKNTEKKRGRKAKKLLSYYKNQSILDEKGYLIQDDEYETKRYARYFKNGRYVKYKKWDKKGKLSHIDFFDNNRNRYKREVFSSEGYLLREIFFDLNNNEPKQELLYTEDGFCYLNRWFNPEKGNLQQQFLFDVRTNKGQVFKSNQEFHVYWLNELLQKEETKPFLICDGVGSANKVLEVSKELAYRIYTIHSNHFSYPYKFGSPIKSNHVKVLENLETEEALVALTPRQKDDIVHQFGNYNNVFVIPNAVTEMDEFKGDKDGKLVTMVARYHEEKGIDEAIEAFRIVVNQIPDARLEIYGDGPHKETLSSLIKDLSLEENVKLKGYTTNVEEVFGKALFSLLTSKYEGLSVVTLESMANSTPLISYDVLYGSSDLIKDGYDGYLVEERNKDIMAERIIHLLHHPDLAKEMGIRGKEKVLKNYSEEVVTNKWIELFEHLEDTGQKM
ncbi:glycosyltransferase [Bacillus sp. V59.32b]|uniref:glycosyltransferase n=1 Tax=Bacillus sp. V59.32b TaxID=1758642 RepID=UPI000E3CB48A|nr:glycosyltransferase [Bacillus sp. V59.32b]RFU66841.1 glycosyltransferase [Bacillus sp. V59.32b]